MPGGRPKKSTEKDPDGEENDSEPEGSTKVVSLLETIALGMDQLLKSNLGSSTADNDNPTDNIHISSKNKSKKSDPNEAIANLIPGLAMGSIITNRQAAKSGEPRTAADNITCLIKWPQEYIYTVSGCQLKFKDMSLVQFVRGFIAMMNDSPVDMRPYMLTHLSETMVDAEKFDWDSVLKFQAEVFHGIEAGKITFKNLDTINLWRLRHNFQPIPINTGQECEEDPPEPDLSFECLS